MLLQVPKQCNGAGQQFQQCFKDYLVYSYSPKLKSFLMKNGSKSFTYSTNLLAKGLSLDPNCYQCHLTLKIKTIFSEIVIRLLCVGVRIHFCSLQPDMIPHLRQSGSLHISCSFEERMRLIVSVSSSSLFSLWSLWLHGNDHVFRDGQMIPITLQQRFTHFLSFHLKQSAQQHLSGLSFLHSPPENNDSIPPGFCVVNLGKERYGTHSRIILVDGAWDPKTTNMCLGQCLWNSNNSVTQ